MRPAVSAGSAFFAELQNFTDVSIAYDAHDGYLLAVAENLSASGAYGAAVETWALESGTWVELHPTDSPPARIGSALAYDPASSSVLLFGGLGPGGLLADTWAFSSGAWTNLTSSAGLVPPARAGASLAWDTNSSEAVLFGGVGANGLNWTNSTTKLVQTWTFSSSGLWTSTSQSASSAPVAGGAMAYDPAESSIVYAVAGSPSAACGGSDSTWEYTPGGWSNVSSSYSSAPSGRLGASAAYLPSRSELLLFGGADCHGERNDTWSLTSSGWSEVGVSSAPSPRSSAQWAYDPSEAGAVLFGGFSATGPESDTWLYTTAGWGLVGPVLELEGAVESAGIPTGDAGTSLTVEVQGALAVGPTQFAYVGLPPACPAPNVAVFDCAGGLPGLYNLTGSIESSAGASSTPTVALRLNSAPQIVALRLTQTETEIGVPVTLTVEASGGTGAYQYAYSGLPPGCAGSDSAQLVCGPTAEGAYPINASIVDAVGGTSAATLTLVVGPHPFVTGVSVSRSPIDVGQSTVVSVVAGGGVGPLSFRYADLPAGCASENETALSCAPTATGTFGVEATATDQYGFTASASIPLSVHSELVAPSLSVNASSVYLDGAVGFTLAVSGGTLPYAFEYTGLPIGCPSVDSATLDCSPASTGGFNVTATVVDALGESVTRTTTLTVTIRPVSTGQTPSPKGPSASPYATLLGAALVGVIALAVVGALLVRRGIQRARRGGEIVDGLIDQAGKLGTDYGRIDDPTRRR